MSKRSLVEQLDEAVLGLLASPAALSPLGDRRVERLMHIAVELRNLPRPQFKARLKSDLQRRASMAAISEPLAAVDQTATPFLTVEDAAKAIEFYKRAFGAAEAWRFEDRGKIGCAEITIGNSRIRLADEFPDYGSVSPKALGGSPVRLHLFVEDADAFAERAVAAGATIARPVEDQFYGDRSGQVADPFGYLWIVATRKEVVSADEMHRRWDAILDREQAKKPRVDPIRKGFRTITPYMIAADGPALLDFAKRAFGAEEMFRGIGSAGGLHGEVKIGDSMLMMGGGIPGKEFRATPSTTALHVYVKDVDAVYQQALAAGATSAGEPRDQEYGERSAGVKDLAGNYWYIATHKGPRYVPEGLSDVNVYMHPLRAEPVINFLKRAFGAQELVKYASPDGVVHHAEVRVGNSVLEMGEAHGPYQPMSSVFYLYVPDVDAAYRRALQAGASSISEPADQPYGDRNAGVKDPFGNTWYIATHVKDATM
jgi:PhnB protein